MDYQKDLELFTVRPYRSKRLKSYFNGNMAHDNDHVIVDDNVKDALVAQGFNIKEEPRSIYHVEALFEALSAYAPGKIPEPTRGTMYSAGISLARKCFAKPKDRPYLEILPFTPETIVKVTSNPSGSAGITNYGCSKAESQTRALERGLQTLLGVKQSEPCIAFKRTQAGKFGRLIWGYPYSETAIEGTVAFPLLEEFKRGHTPMAFAMATGVLGTKLRVASYHHEWAYSLDMSQFDATLSSGLIHNAFSILRTWFDPTAIEPVSGKSVREIFDHIEHYFIHTTIVMPNGKIYIGKDHGVPSGSYFTQIVDSICNVIICGTISSRFELNVSRKEIFVLGDDLLFWTNRKMDLDLIAKFAAENLHVKLHGKEKSAIYHYDEAIHYLGRDWYQGIPTLSEEEIISKMVYPESFRKYSKDPRERKRQVHMLLLSYAAVYRNAWNIAFPLIDGSNSNRHRGCSNVDVEVYVREGDTGGLDDKALSGYDRYRRKYILERDSKDIPITAVQFWL